MAKAPSSKALRRLTKILRYTARAALMTLTTFWFVFALLSGSADQGGGFKGLLINSLNALPWLVLFLLILVALKRELLGGSLIAAAGLFTVFFFGAARSPVVLYGISLPLIILGGALVASWLLTRSGFSSTER